MTQLINHRKWTMLMLMVAAALGCASAALSGTIAVLSYSAPLATEAPAGRSA